MTNTRYRNGLYKFKFDGVPPLSASHDRYQMIDSYDHRPVSLRIDKLKFED